MIMQDAFRKIDTMSHEMLRIQSTQLKQLIDNASDIFLLEDALELRKYVDQRLSVYDYMDGHT